jgi:hypothetical protein
MVPTHPPRATSPNHAGTVWWRAMPFPAWWRALHKAKVITKWLGEQNIDILGPWSGNSPDLNPIENFWLILKRRVDKQNPTNSDKLVRVCFNSHSGYIISYTVPDKLICRLSVFVDIILWSYLERITVRVIKTILKCGFRLVRPALNSPYHGYFLFEFLPIEKEEQNGVVVRFAERRAREGLVGMAEVGVTVVECFSSASTTVGMLIELRQPFPQICFVKIPSYNKCSLGICGYQFA